MRISQAARDKLKPIVEREAKLDGRWSKGGQYALMNTPKESVKSVEQAEFALHHLADAVELFDLDGSRKKTSEWWDAMIASDCLDLLGTAVTAFVSQDDAAIKSRRPRRGWTVSEVRMMVLLGYRGIMAAVLHRDQGDLHAAVLGFQLSLDPEVSPVPRS